MSGLYNMPMYGVDFQGVIGRAIKYLVEGGAVAVALLSSLDLSQ